ncbi:MAG: SDR family oxidoreductase [Candidatus Omnitrophica bacterium]|nr:SDR family oxidoreductase [Candidatus Omnitrophota bacterium]
MAKYLVTGGAGFIGSHIVEELRARGENIVILDNFYSGKPENLAAGADALPDWYREKAAAANVFDLVTWSQGNVTCIKGDIRDYRACVKACHGVDYVLHQGALRSVPKSMDDPYSYNAVNIDGTLNLLRAARECGAKRFVFASSSSVYGDTDQFPQKETAYPLLISPYALSKLTGEYYCRIFAVNYGLETVALRYFNVFGPRQALDDEYAVVIPKFITCILNGEQPPIFGNGKQSRDFSFVKNVVKANLAAAVQPKVGGEVFNVACGRDNSVLQLVEFLNEFAGTQIEPKFLPVRLGDVFKTHADITKLSALLNAAPDYDFKQGLKITFEWFKQKYAAGR